MLMMATKQMVISEMILPELSLNGRTWHRVAGREFLPTMEISNRLDNKFAGLDGSCRTAPPVKLDEDKFAATVDDSTRMPVSVAVQATGAMLLSRGTGFKEVICDD